MHLSFILSKFSPLVPSDTVSFISPILLWYWTVKVAMVRTRDNTFVTGASMDPSEHFSIHSNTPGQAWRSVFMSNSYNCTVQRSLNSVWSAKPGVVQEAASVCKWQFMWSLKKLSSTHCLCELNNLQFDFHGSRMLWLLTYVHWLVCHRIFGWTATLLSPLDVRV